MSMAAAHALVDRVDHDEMFRSALIGANGIESRLQMAQQAGFDVTAEDMAELRRETAVQDISERDLQRIRGGKLTDAELALYTDTTALVAALFSLRAPRQESRARDRRRPTARRLQSNGIGSPRARR